MGTMKENYSKTMRYCKKNGLVKTIFAAAERVAVQPYRDYDYEMPDEDTLDSQRCHEWEEMPKISLLVPAYETNEAFFKAMVESVLAQSYPNWELIIADGSVTENVEQMAETFCTGEERIKYLKLEQNLGISENTNAALEEATGGYIGLLDHDDLLTPNALFEVARIITGSSPILIYSDEDKTDETGEHFFEPHFKRKLNLELILSNNYICHLCVIKADIIKQLKFRAEYDGAQDYDMILRTIAMAEHASDIVYLPMVLYHWRCHQGSTAVNTESKEYAYLSGKRAIVDFCMQRGWNVSVHDTDHQGFYRVEYIPDMFTVRKRAGVIGGPIYRGAKIVGGAMHRDQTILFKDLPKAYSGYMHQASLRQEVSVVDLRNVCVRDELKTLYDEYMNKAEEEGKKADWLSLSVSFCEQVRMAGYQIIYDPYQKAVKH